MNTETRQITISGISVEVVRKDIKNLHLAVYPPTGRVRIAAPLRVNDEAVRLFVVSKLAWIKKHQEQFESQERQTVRNYVSGESHYYQGERYLLNVIPHAGGGRVVVRNKTYIDLYVREGSDLEQRSRVMTEWYRRELKAQIAPLFAKWQEIIGVEVREWGVRQMKTKWGTCSIAARRIWLNLDLAMKPERCLEYILVHEMTHLLERHHNERFVMYMDKFLPHWRSLRTELNRFVLNPAEWDY